MITKYSLHGFSFSAGYVCDAFSVDPRSRCCPGRGDQFSCQWVISLSHFFLFSFSYSSNSIVYVIDFYGDIKINTTNLITSLKILSWKYLPSALKIEYKLKQTFGMVEWECQFAISIPQVILYLLFILALILCLFSLRLLAGDAMLFLNVATHMNSVFPAACIRRW